MKKGKKSAGESVPAGSRLSLHRKRISAHASSKRRMNQAFKSRKHPTAHKSEEDMLQAALRALESRRPPFPRFPISGPPTGYEGKVMLSMPEHKMVYCEEIGMEGVEIETLEGMRIAFDGKHALERFIREKSVSPEDSAGLRAIHARADLLRSPEPDFGRPQTECDMRARIGKPPTG
jgi:hypothetical protein